MAKNKDSGFGTTRSDLPRLDRWTVVTKGLPKYPFGDETDHLRDGWPTLAIMDADRTQLKSRGLADIAKGRDSRAAIRFFDTESHTPIKSLLSINTYSMYDEESVELVAEIIEKDPYLDRSKIADYMAENGLRANVGHFVDKWESGRLRKLLSTKYYFNFDIRHDILVQLSGLKTDTFLTSYLKPFLIKALHEREFEDLINGKKSPYVNSIQCAHPWELWFYKCMARRLSKHPYLDMEEQWLNFIKRHNAKLGLAWQPSLMQRIRIKNKGKHDKPKPTLTYFGYQSGY